ncbi:SpaH/EbpB family LPXTG-anchored major pilin [Corynebacterium ulceribovis]|uniref:SpaH/EbpB family LPXTG-anchored major pilin n=1 Tax=Corynebacterium ulceribovis TaxID=487732 RepID=UPI000399888A|nr:SpaH/EbpB family LPXTG-anchored major pilin [Corynebacterium ulceribovis]
MNKHSYLARSLAAAAVIGLSSVAMSPVAVAQEPAASPVITQDTGTLTIHKYANPDTTGTPTGEAGDLPSGTTLDGVGFTVYKIDDIDLNTNAGLAAAANIKASDYVNGTDVTGATQEGDERFTAGGGQIVLNDLPIGAYLVVETTPKDGYSPAAPFIAFVPMTSGNAETGGTKWNYDVHAYPKNYENTATKEVEDSNQNAGDTVAFTITSDVPPVAENATSISKYVVEDDLQENLLEAGQVVSVKGSNGTEYALNDDYSVTVDESTQKITVTFTETGLGKLTEAKKADSSFKVVTTINATVKAPSETGKLVNEATVISNNGSGGGDTTVKTNETVSYWGNIKITKVDAGDPEKTLDGAVFELYNAGDNGTCEAADKNDDQKITSNGESSWETKDGGTLTITGLHVTNFDDNTAENSGQAPKYCLFEVKSPAGYELLSKPIDFELTKENVDATPGVYTLTSEVKNLKDTTPNLPMTGGMGIGVLAAIGAAIIGIGAWFARRGAKN